MGFFLLWQLRECPLPQAPPGARLPLCLLAESLSQPPRVLGSHSPAASLSQTLSGLSFPVPWKRCVVGGQVCAGTHSGCDGATPGQKLSEPAPALPLSLSLWQGTRQRGWLLCQPPEAEETWTVPSPHVVRTTACRHHSETRPSLTVEGEACSDLQ